MVQIRLSVVGALMHSKYSTKLSRAGKFSQMVMLNPVPLGICYGSVCLIKAQSKETLDLLLEILPPCYLQK